MKVLHLTTIAASLGMVAASLPSHFASATSTMSDMSGATPGQARAFIAARKAFGGKAAFMNNLTSQNRTAIVTCISLAWCLDHFGGKFGPNNLEAVRAKINEAGLLK
jgi:hypothetical protein